MREARISDHGLRQVSIDVNVSDRGWLVFTESYFPGWKAYIRPFGAQGEGVNASGESVETQVPIYRADGAFRAVYLDQAGQWTVRFVYSPRSVVLGLYLSFLAAITLLLMAGAWAWNRFYRGEGSEIGTAAKNTLVQVAMSLLNRVIDLAFTMLRLRVLGPAGEGSYVNAINFYLVFDILTKFGLGTLMTRDVARDRGQARRYLANVVGLRTILWLASLPVVFLTGLAYRAGGKLSGEEAQAIAIFIGALFFANIADAISSVFNGFEKMEYPAGLATAVTVGKVALGALVLLPPFNMGFVGLAWVSLVMNVVQVIWLYVVMQAKVLSQVDKDEGEPKGRAVGKRRRPLAAPRRSRPGPEPAAADVPRVRPPHAQQLAGDHVLARQPVRAAWRHESGRPGHFLSGGQVPRRAQRDPQLLHPGDLPADEPLCASRQRGIGQGIPAGRAAVAHPGAARRRFLYVCGHPAGADRGRHGLPARLGHCLPHHDLVHPDRLHQLRDAVRADCRQPAAVPHQGFHHRL